MDGLEYRDSVVGRSHIAAKAGDTIKIWYTLYDRNMNILKQVKAGTPVSFTVTYGLPAVQLGCPVVKFEFVIGGHHALPKGTPFLTLG